MVKNSKNIGPTGELLPGAKDILATWRARKIQVRPYGDQWWSFNPSVHFDETTEAWRCAVRCANYCLPGGVPHLSATSRRGRAETKAVLVELDRETLEVSRLHEMSDLVDRPRSSACPSIGIEDMRLFRTARDGLVGVATALEFNVDHPSRPEIVVCRFDRDYRIVDARPIRGSWSSRPQKNWSPFDGAPEPRFLYSIERGVVMSDRGAVRGDPTPKRIAAGDNAGRVGNLGPAIPGSGRTGAEVRVAATMTQRIATSQSVSARARSESTELRGGTQLIRVGPDCWIGVAHEMRLVTAARRKLYWHTVYAVDNDGVMVARSRPFKLSPAHPIEFAAGLAVEPSGRAVISFGTDDQDAWIAETTVHALHDLLEPWSAELDADRDDEHEREGGADNDASE